MTKSLTHYVAAGAVLATSGLTISTLQPGRLWAANPTPSKEVSVVASAPTHVGVSPADMVRLEGISIPAGASFQRRLLDGTTDAGPATHGYEVPAGMVLVITDADWIFNSGAAESNVTLTVTSRNGPFSQGSFLFTSTARGDGDGSGGASHFGTTGFAIGAGRNLLAHTASATLQYVVLRGYLKPE
jgi:hypothetical protein